MEESRLGSFRIGDFGISWIDGFEGVEAITLKVTRNELLLMTEDNFELLGLLRENVDLEALWVKGVDLDKWVL